MPANLLWRVMMALVVIGAAASQAHAYGYAEAEDPVVPIFRDGASAARGGDFSTAASKAREALAIIKSHKLSGPALAPKIEAATKSKDAQAMARLLANIVYLSMKQKLETNIADKLANFPDSKARLFLARKSYADVLEGNLKKNDPELDGKILLWFDEALAALGNPGLFGIGQKPADLGRFTRAARDIEQAIEGFYTSFDKQ